MTVLVTTVRWRLKSFHVRKRLIPCDFFRGAVRAMTAKWTPDIALQRRCLFRVGADTALAKHYQARACCPRCNHLAIDPAEARK